MSLPDRIVTDWRRFSSGLWRVSEGDISAAYCADTFPKIRVFTHENRLFTNTSACYSGPFNSSADCYPLILPEDYQGPEPARYTYEGREARFQGRTVKLGRKVHFAASEPSVAECQRQMRIMYADGGWFTRHATYGECLAEEFSEPKIENAREALRLEMSGEFAALSKEQIRCLLDERTSIPAPTRQLDLAL